jgi:SAM-dependent methyltransferase
MPDSKLDIRISNTLNKSRFFRYLFFNYTGFFDLKNRIIKREIRRWLKTAPASPRILDVGVGFCQQIHYVLSIAPKANILGLDLSKEVVAFANKFYSRKKKQNVYCKQESISDFNGNASFDLVLAINLLNYVKNDQQALTAMYNSLKVDGLLIIVNHYSVKSHIVSEYFDDIHTLPMYRSGYTKEHIKELLKNAGFTKIKSRFIYGHTGFLAWKLAIEYPSSFLKKSKLFYLFLPLYILLILPFTLILNYYDSHIGHTSGHSLFIRAIK